jgi:kynurenine formamidase
MEIIDLSQEIYTRRPSTPSQPTPIVWTNVHHGDYTFKHSDFSVSSKGLIMSDHCGTHVDAFSHFDAAPDALSTDRMPLEKFFTPAICLDFSHIPAGTYITTLDIEAGLTKTGLAIRPGDTFLMRIGHLGEGIREAPVRVFERQALLEHYLKGFPGLDREATEWLSDRGVIHIGTEARTVDNPSQEDWASDPPNPCHTVCRDRKIVVTENLVIPERLVGRRFIYAAFPLKIREGTGSPVRAVAILGLDLEVLEASA